MQKAKIGNFNKTVRLMFEDEAEFGKLRISVAAVDNRFRPSFSTAIIQNDTCVFQCSVSFNGFFNLPITFVFLLNKQ